MKIGIVGAECSGKSTLSTWLSIELKSRYASVALIPEYLREWSTHHGRPPRAHEQAHVASTQAAHIRQAQAICVVADTTPLVTAVYSDVLFQDSSLYGSAVTFQRSLDLTLLACVDLPWVADGIQRDGVAVQRRIDARLREVLLTHQLPFATVYGLGAHRQQAALQAIDHADATHRAGLPASQGPTWAWICDTCSDADCEHRLFSRLTRPPLVGV
ncbi:ATP-binding protein [Rhodoferax sp.]|uniref:ATP-binding protein n=1 Tax=Rhodoferax sp. TaxID=50421 RepID=UPI002ACDDF69|nr:ATP-binding protein [Rhodoferax sp.]MDZ7921258.1 ATP-binding protein [Rhodoferax sp.]